ncbi:MAG: haloacid dehalogenase-like hydrolase [Planctomycetota bacterium]|nr:haloacid dehalogenase-like hydrolase [Planctomycetota bacterium]
MPPQNVIALVCDFDDTLTPDSTTQLLEAYDVDSQDFWQRRVAELVSREFDPTIAFLTAFLELVAPGKPFAGLTNAKLREFGARLDFYPGLPEVFDDLQEIADGYELSRPAVEVYVISGGLEEVILGSKLAGRFAGVRACRLEEDPATRQVARIQNAVDFTGKTRHLFEISKGVLSRARGNPFLVNEPVPDDDRRVPFRNIIYCGDGLTDIASFSVVEQRGGSAFALFDPERHALVKRAWVKFVRPRRVSNVNSPKYGPRDDLGALLRMAVHTICSRLEHEVGKHLA